MTIVKDKGQPSRPVRDDPALPLEVGLLTYIAYAIIIVIGHLRDFVAQSTGLSRYRDKKRIGYSPLFKSWENFYTRRLYHRIQDCWNRPICSAPAASRMVIMERSSHDEQCTMHTTGNTIPCLNLGSYNYLGFADDWQSSCRDKVMAAVDEWPISCGASRQHLGNIALHEELEKVIAKFVGKEDAMIFPMGYGTNTANIPALVPPGSLIISDSLNHLSIVNGARNSGAQIRIFEHNNWGQLESILKEAVLKGQPKYYRPWSKIVVMVEGIYSMEGDICELASIVRICKKYKAYLYVDEAHSIGALGKTGRGICEHCGVNPDDVDVLMGTFTKSFSGMGGYVAASKEVINFLRCRSSGSLYHNSMSPIVCKQIITALNIISGEDGSDLGQQKITSLAENSNYFRSEMIRLGLHVYGDWDSPIVPVLIYQPGKIAAFSRECLKRGVAIVVVGFPATTVILSRARFCLSAGHTREDLERAVKVIDEVTSLIGLKYNKGLLGF